MIAKTGTAYGSTTTNATANRTAADHTGHHSVDSRGRSRAAMRTMRTDALTAITSCSLTVATPAGSPPEARSATSYTRVPASTRNPRARTARTTDHERVVSNRSRTRAETRAGEAMRRPTVTATIGRK